MRGLKNKDVGGTTDFHFFFFYLCQFKIISENDCEAIKKDIRVIYKPAYLYLQYRTHSGFTEQQ